MRTLAGKVYWIDIRQEKLTKSSCEHRKHYGENICKEKQTTNDGWVILYISFFFQIEVKPDLYGH